MRFIRNDYKTGIGLALFLYGLLLTLPALSQCYKIESDIAVESMKSAQKLHNLDVDTTQVDAAFNALRHGKLLKSQYAALFLAKRGEQEAIDLIKQKYQQEKEFTRGALRYLKALHMLNASSTETLLNSFADSVYQNISTGNAARSDYFVYQDLIKILIEKNNYSQFNRVIEQLKSKNNAENRDILLNLLPAFFKIEELREEVIETLQFVLQNYSSSDDLFYVVNFTCAFPESEKLQEALKKIAVEASSQEIRWWALVRLQETYNDENLLDLALNNLENTSISSEIDKYLSIITSEYTPRSLLLLENLKDNSSNNVVREKAAEIYDNYWWLYFEPVGKVFSYSLPQTLDSLHAHTQAVASYDWLGDQGFVKELTNRLENANRHLARGDSANAANQIANYQERLQQVYEQNSQNNNPRFVTEDGFKFLFKNAEYILSQLPQHPSNPDNK